MIKTHVLAGGATNMRQIVIETPNGKWEVEGINDDMVHLTLQTDHIDLLVNVDVIAKLNLKLPINLRYRLIPIELKWYHRIDGKGYLENPFGICLDGWVWAKRLIHVMSKDIGNFCDPLMKEGTEVSVRVKPIKRMISLLP